LDNSLIFAHVPVKQMTLQIESVKLMNPLISNVNGAQLFDLLNENKSVPPVIAKPPKKKIPIDLSLMDPI